MLGRRNPVGADFSPPSCSDSVYVWGRGGGDQSRPLRPLREDRSTMSKYVFLLEREKVRYNSLHACGRRQVVRPKLPKLLHYSVCFLLKSLSDLVRFIYRFPLYQAHGMKNGKSRSILISIQNAHTNARTPSKRRRSIYCYGAGDGTRTREMKAWEAFALPLGHARVGEHYTPSAPISLVY